MIYHIVYDKRSGDIVHIHTVYDSEKRTFLRIDKEEALSTLTPHVEDVQAVDIITVETREGIDAILEDCNGRIPSLFPLALCDGRGSHLRRCMRPRWVR